jgi:hypothetical protein
MQKTIYAPETIKEIILRIEKLKPTDTAKWGEMNATEMLAHCNLAHYSILKVQPSGETPTIKQRLGKFIFFNLKNEFPRLAKGPRRFDMKGKVDLAAFEEELSKYKHIIGKYGKLEQQLHGNHPKLGPLNHAEWGRFVWMHADHHLRQFGL